MSATSDLRLMLDEMGEPYVTSGGYTTLVKNDRFGFTVRDNYSSLRTFAVSLSKMLTIEDVVELVRGRTAKMTSTCDENGVGSSKCDACGGSVNRHDRFCRWCGARFT